MVVVLVNDHTRRFLKRSCRCVLRQGGRHLLKGVFILLSILPRLNLLIIDGRDASVDERKASVSVTVAHKYSASYQNHGQDRKNRAQSNGERSVRLMLLLVVAVNAGG